MRVDVIIDPYKVIRQYAETDSAQKYALAHPAVIKKTAPQNRHRYNFTRIA